MYRYDVMLSYVPLYYHTSNIFKAVLAAEGGEFDLLRQNTQDLEAQLFITTATWGLEFWEKEYGLPVNLQLSYTDRRSRVMAKARGIGKVGTDLIESIAQAFSNGEVSVGFDGRVRIKFIGTRGVPEAMDELKKQINQVVPAHLPVVYEYTYLLWKEFDLISAGTQESMTWAQLEVYKP